MADGSPPTFTTRARDGVVCSVDRLASEAGVTLLRAGGSAADAAIAASAVLTVTTQHMCGLGGDLFALVDDGRGNTTAPAALNASGRSGTGPACSAERLRAEGHLSMPFRGDLRSTPVPGCVDGWLALHGRYGRRPLAEVLAPAVALAHDGFPASPLLAASLYRVATVAAIDDYVIDGSLAVEGQPIRRPGVARTLEAVSELGRDGFYAGEFGRGVLRLAPEVFRPDDFGQPLADWVEPLPLSAWGHEVWTMPPNSQGYLVLLGAGIASSLDLGDAPTGEWAHLLVEAARVAGFDRPVVLSEHADVSRLLAPAEVQRRAQMIDPARRARLATHTRPGGTIYLCAVDADRMGVSLIQSNAAGFGAHIVEPSTGIFLQNRGVGFSLEPGHPAEFGPGRRPPHTLAPALVRNADGALAGILGTMGGDSQPQILLQLLARLLHHGERPGDAIGAGRWVLDSGTGQGFDTWDDADAAAVAIEAHAPADWRAALARRGHQVVVRPTAQGFGHAHAITVGADGFLDGAADPRSLIGSAAGY